MLSYDKNLRIYTSSLLKSVTAGFGTKQLGDGRNTEVVRSIIPKNTVIIAPHQTHSTDIVEYTGSPLGDCDGVVTKQKNVALTVITADCVPIIFSDPVNGVVGISHQGWKGTLNKLPQKMIQKMISVGASKQNIVCAIGPAINDCCYEIYGDRLDKFQTAFGNEVIRKSATQQYLNLAKANYITLLDSGIKPENIDRFPFCTSCNSEQFWSYHRDGGIKGEMISFVVQ